MTACSGRPSEPCGSEKGPVCVCVCGKGEGRGCGEGVCM